MTPAALDTDSVIAVYSAIVVYVLAFIAFALDLSARSARSLSDQDQEVARPTGILAAAAASASVGRTSLLDRTGTAIGAGAAVPRVSKFERIGFALTIIGWLVHVAADVLRGLAAGRVPWSDMYEFALTGTAIMVGVFIGVQFWRDVRFLGTYITGLVAIFLGLAAVNLYVPIAPLSPPLQSYWLVVHVFVATLGTGFLAVGAGLSLLQLLQVRRETGVSQRFRFLSTLPASEVLESMAYRVIVVGFAFWTFTLIAGAIWAESAWGRYWGWDTKEVWTFVIWVVFAGYIHARATRGWRGSRAAYLAIIGFAAVLFNFTVVNLLFHGLHAYSGLGS